MTIGAILATAGAGALGIAAHKVVEKLVDKGIDKTGTSLNHALSAIHRQWHNGAGQTYVTATQSIRVEPFILVDARVARLPYIKDVMNTAQRIFTSYYLMSVAADNTVNGVRVSKYLDKFAPDRDLNAATQEFLSTESYQFGLPFVGEVCGMERYSHYSAESDDSKKSGSTFDRKVVQEIANLAVGQIVDVKITDGSNSATVPVQIRLRPIGMDPVVIREVLALGGENQSQSARWRRWKVGELSLFRDLLFNQDQIDRYRRAAMKDTSGYFRKVHARQNKSLIATFMSDTPSIGAASSIAVVSKETVRELEDQITGRLADFEARQRIFDDSLLMLLFVIDEDHEVVTLYTRDMDDSAVYSIKDLKGKSDDKADLTDIMRSFLEGRIPGRL